jgi:hypothetical protein
MLIVAHRYKQLVSAWTAVAVVIRTWRFRTFAARKMSANVTNNAESTSL